MKILFTTTNEKVLIDDEDYEKLVSYKFYSTGRTGSKQKYVQFIFNKKLVYIHRFLTGVQKNMVVDHINGNPMDNRKENLRVCTQQQNTWNKLNNKKPAKSGFKGVYSNGRNGWFSQIVVNYKSHYLGFFKSKKEAHEAYNQARKIYFKIPNFAISN